MEGLWMVFLPEGSLVNFPMCTRRTSLFWVEDVSLEWPWIAMIWRAKSGGRFQAPYESTAVE